MRRPAGLRGIGTNPTTTRPTGLPAGRRTRNDTLLHGRLPRRTSRRVGQPRHELLLELDLAEAGVECLEPGRRPALSEYLADILARERYVARRRAVVAAGERASDAARAEAELTVRCTPGCTERAEADIRDVQGARRL